MIKRFYDGTNISFVPCSINIMNLEKFYNVLMYSVLITKPTILSADDQFVPCKEDEDADLKASIVEIPADKVRTKS